MYLKQHVGKEKYFKYPLHSDKFYVVRVFKEHLTFLYFMGKEHTSVLNMTLGTTSLMNSHQALLLQNVLKINFLCPLCLGMLMKIEDIIKMSGSVI